MYWNRISYFSLKPALNPTKSRGHGPDHLTKSFQLLELLYVYD